MKKRYRVICALMIFALFVSHAAFAGGTGEAAAPEEVEISILTWNHAFYEDTINQWFAEFQEMHPNATVNWIDKKGGELPTYFQTQLAAGTPPDLVDIQGMIWYGYAEDGALLDLTPFYNNDRDMQEIFDEKVLEVGGRYKGKVYMFPHYAASTVLFYNKLLFKQAGIDSPPETVEELIADAQKLTNGDVSGFVSLNFDWMYWPFFMSKGVTILNAAGDRAAFNTPAAVEVLTTLSNLTEKGVIDTITWTGRWAEPNGLFGAGNAAMLHAHINAQRAFRSNSDWSADEENVGVAAFPGGWTVPNYHSIGISSGTKSPELAWDLLKVIMSDKWNTQYGVDIGTLPSNSRSLNELLSDPTFSREHSLLARMFEVNRSVNATLCCTTGSPKDAEIKDAVFSQVQQAVLGQKSPADALADAETQVNRILSR